MATKRSTTVSLGTKSRTTAKRKSSGRVSSKAKSKPTETAAETSAPAAAGVPAGDPGKLRIRMYQVGFGDCFLLSIPQGADHQHVLIDCGVHAQGHIKDGAVDRMTNVAAIAALLCGSAFAQVGTAVKEGAKATGEKTQQIGDEAKASVSSQPDRAVDKAKASAHKAKAHRHAAKAKDAAKEIPK